VTKRGNRRAGASERRYKTALDQGRYDHEVLAEELGIELDKQSATPLWQQLVDQLRARILDGTAQPDQKLPTEEAMTEAYGVGRSTVTRALKILGSEGLVVYVPGRGSFTALASDIAKARRRR
jgi:DNA-binding transcriptional regulator YhcF (GntR family)